jgi:NAD+ synthase
MPALTPQFREDHVEIVTSFIRHQVASSGRRGVVLGLSGGIDSAVVAKLCAEAIGPTRVLALGLPLGAGGQDVEDARGWAKSLGVEFRVIDITPLVRTFEEVLDATRADHITRGNLRPRVRMVVLYYFANLEGRVVMGTGNKSELAISYFSKFGDGGVDFLPIGDLYKTQVRAMARHLGVPEVILRKTPSAGLWEGQTDEAELGIAYDELDRILLGIELQMDFEAIAEKTGSSVETVKRIEAIVASTVHKRKMPLIPKLGARTFGLDWRE